MQTKYKKSDKCVICGKQIINGKHDGNFYVMNVLK